MTQAELLSVVRTLLGVLGTWLATSGYVSSSDWQTITGAVLVIIPLVWGVIQKKQAHAAIVQAAATGVATPVSATGPVTPPAPVQGAKP